MPAIAAAPASRTEEESNIECIDRAPVSSESIFAVVMRDARRAFRFLLLLPSLLGSTHPQLHAHSARRLHNQQNQQQRLVLDGPGSVHNPLDPRQRWEAVARAKKREMELRLGNKTSRLGLNEIARISVIGEVCGRMRWHAHGPSQCSTLSIAATFGHDVYGKTPADQHRPCDQRQRVPVRRFQASIHGLWLIGLSSF